MENAGDETAQFLNIDAQHASKSLWRGIGGRFLARNHLRLQHAPSRLG